VQITGTPPTGFSTSTNYYVVLSTTAGVQLSATLGGSAITPTSGGTSPVMVVQTHGLAVGDLIALTTVGSLTIDGATPVANSVYQVTSVPSETTFTLSAGPGATKSGANYSGTTLTLGGSATSVFRKATGGRIASVPLPPHFAGSIRLNVQGAAGSAAGGIIIASASLVYGRDTAAIG
jgi:hypothetical protein